MKDKSLRVLMIDDSEDDVLLIIRELKKGGYNPVFERVETAFSTKEALKAKQWDIILCDYKMPDFSGPSAIALLKESNTDIPIIIISGAIGEETAVECMRLGAQDYMMKNNLSRLCPAIARELQEVKVRGRQKQTEDALKKSEERFKSQYQGSPIPTFTWQKIGTDFVLLECNDAALTATRGNADKFINKTAQEMYREQQDVLQDIRRCFEEKSVIKKESLSKHFMVGRNIIATYVFVPDDLVMVHVEDITERKQAEEALHRMNRALQAVSSCNKALIRAEDEQTLLEEICRIICDKAGYRMAWVGYAENDDARTIRPIAWAGFEDGYLATVNITWADTERGRGPSGIVIRSREIVCVQDYATDPRVAPWRENALKRGYRSSISLPLKDESAATFGELAIYSIEPNAFTPDEIQLLEELTDDLAFGIITLRMRDERNKTEEQLRLTNEIMQNLSEGIVLIQASNSMILQTNPKFDMIFGYASGELIGQDINIINAPRDEKLPEQISNEIISSLTETGKWSGEVYNRKKDGTPFWCYANVSAFDHPSYGKLWVSAHTDITERKQAEEQLLNSENKFASVFHLNPNPIAITDTVTWNFMDVNQAFTDWTGYSPEEIIGASVRDLNLWVNLEDRKKIIDALTIAGGVDRREVMIRIKNGNLRNVLFSSRFIEINQERYLLSLALDITERKLVEERYKSLFENAQEGIYRSTPEGRFILTNHSMAQILGYGSPEELIAGITDIPGQLYVDSEERKKFIEVIEKQGFARNFETQFYRKDGRIIWISLTTTAIRDYKGQIQYFEGIAADITDKKDSVERMRNALNGTVRAIASIVESRDPYTAGHQRRVSDLARAIAAEMGFSADRIEGLRMAATIHDIGKISVPAEMLTKPTKLTNIEFSLIKTHVQAGFDILKDIEFPWPIARMVLEHHERMNGSGYPNGLTGDNILLESRILAVADVVEAMGSHRPYRASLGIVPALEEIEKNKGILYDIAVADVCLKLFREKGYQFI
ncbi:MAG: PAS domain S-box protein [Smithella sp.]|jgi:PAS domain S-box-containing protein